MGGGLPPIVIDNATTVATPVRLCSAQALSTSSVMSFDGCARHRDSEMLCILQVVTHIVLKNASIEPPNAITNVKNVATPRTSCSESDVSNHPFIVFDTFYTPLIIMFVMGRSATCTIYDCSNQKFGSHITITSFPGPQSQLKAVSCHCIYQQSCKLT